MRDLNAWLPKSAWASQKSLYRRDGSDDVDGTAKEEQPAAAGEAVSLGKSELVLDPQLRHAQPDPPATADG